MALSTVWLFFILSAGPFAPHQAIDHFPTQVACQAFRLNVQQMLDQGLAAGSRVTDCVSRAIVTIP